MDYFDYIYYGILNGTFWQKSNLIFFDTNVNEDHFSFIAIV